MQTHAIKIMETKNLYTLTHTYTRNWSKRKSERFNYFEFIIIFFCSFFCWCCCCCYGCSYFVFITIMLSNHCYYQNWFSFGFPIFFYTVKYLHFFVYELQGFLFFVYLIVKKSISLFSFEKKNIFFVLNWMKLKRRTFFFYRV